MEILTERDFMRSLRMSGVPEVQARALTAHAKAQGARWARHHVDAPAFTDEAGFIAHIEAHGVPAAKAAEIVDAFKSQFAAGVDEDALADWLYRAVNHAAGVAVDDEDLTETELSRIAGALAETRSLLFA